MIAELGLGALWLAAALALLQLVLSALGLGKGRAELLSGVRPVAVAQAVLIALSFGSLITLFLRSDMSVLLVAKRRDRCSCRFSSTFTTNCPERARISCVGTALSMQIRISGGLSESEENELTVMPWKSPSWPVVTTVTPLAK